MTANIRKACEKYPDICLLRCLRKESEDEAKDSKGDKNGIIHVKNTAEAVRYLSEKEGNIFLTTGSKELVLWQGLPGHLELGFCNESFLWKLLFISAGNWATAEDISLPCRDRFQRK